MNIPDEPPRRTPRVDTCAWCARSLDAGTRIDVVVADSTYLHPDDPRQDGSRPASACCRDHAEELLSLGARDWVAEQLWAKKLSRALVHWNRTETTMEGIAARAGLTRSQLRRAIQWRGPDGRGHEKSTPPLGLGRGDRDRCFGGTDHGHSDESPSSPMRRP